MSERQEYTPYITERNINEALVLLNFATKNGGVISEETITDITTALNAFRRKGLTAAMEHKFFVAMRALAKSLEPIDFESIKATTEIYVKRPNRLHRLLFLADKPLSEVTTMFFRSITALCLGALLLVQITWLYGSIITNEINIVSANTTKDRAELFQLMVVKKQDDDSRYRIALLEAELKDYSLKYSASQLALQNFFKVIHVGPGISHTRLLADAKDRAILEPLIYVQKAQYLLKVLELYILPLLYGLVGACAYILRTLSQNIKNYTYTGSENAGYFSRLLLGGLSGLAIGWFIDPATASTTTRLSPFALSFIAGYSVELLFSILDRIVGSFAPASKAKEGKG